MSFVKDAILLLVWAGFVEVKTLSPHDYCVDLVPQTHVNIDQLFGMWYGAQVISHTHNDSALNHNCMHVKIWEVHPELNPSTSAPYSSGLADPYYAQRPFEGNLDARYRHLVLQWMEGMLADEYHIRLNMTRRGFWMSTAPVYKLSAMYNHYAVTIQVLKAVNNHLVLNFCTRLPEHQLFTVILSRSENQLSDGELMTIHNLLARKNLSIASQKRVCGNGADVLLSSLILIVISGVLALS